MPMDFFVVKFDLHRIFVIYIHTYIYVSPPDKSSTLKTLKQAHSYIKNTKILKLKKLNPV